MIILFRLFLLRLEEYFFYDKTRNLQSLNDSTEFVDNDRVLKREEVASLGEVFPLQHLQRNKRCFVDRFAKMLFLQYAIR